MLLALFAGLATVFDIDPKNQRAPQAISALQAGGFVIETRPGNLDEQVSRATRAADVNRWGDLMTDRIEWNFINKELDVRLKPKDFRSPIKYVVVSKCPTTGLISSLSIYYKPGLTVEAFGAFAQKISQKVRSQPDHSVSDAGVTLNWGKGVSREAYAYRPKDPALSASATLLGSKKSVECARAFFIGS